MQFTIYQGSRRGARAINQDRYAYTYSREALLLVVADGMGGHADGDVAARVCVRLIVERFQQEAKPALRNPLLFLRDAMARVHEALISYARQVSAAETPRTTCVACIVQAGHACWAHAGDSRLYLFRNDALLAKTRDHTRVEQLAERGLIERSLTGIHPERNQVYSCLGGASAPAIDVGPRTVLADGDLIVLSTDGFWNVITPQEIAEALAAAPVVTAAPLLLGEAERRGGAEGDNATAIVVRWGPEIALREPETTITEGMRHGEFRTHLGRVPEADAARTAPSKLTDEDINRAIAEIRAKIGR